MVLQRLTLAVLRNVFRSNIDTRCRHMQLNKGIALKKELTIPKSGLTYGYRNAVQADHGTV